MNVEENESFKQNGIAKGKLAALVAYRAAAFIEQQVEIPLLIFER